MTENRNFEWHAGVAESAMLHLTGANQRDFFLDKEVCRLVNDRGRKKAREVFGYRPRMPAPSCAHLSYGHMASLGANVRFLDNSEPNVEPMFSNLAEAIRLLKKEEKFAENELFKKYYEIYLYLKDSFSDEQVQFSGFGHQGPLTTAVLLRGTDFYMDLYDEPELAKEYLRLITESIIRFCHFKSQLNGLPPVDPCEGFVTDDLSSLVSPKLWPEFVVPYWEMYYEGITKGKRSIHVENLVPAHLNYLEEVGIEFYDPSVSSKLSPAIIREHIGIDFTWRLLGIDIPNMSVADVEKWVYDAVKEGAWNFHTYIDYMYCLPKNQAKAVAFMDVCEKLEKEWN